jgi:predicted aspartyl protease
MKEKSIFIFSVFVTVLLVLITLNTLGGKSFLSSKINHLVTLNLSTSSTLLKDNKKAVEKPQTTETPQNSEQLKTNAKPLSIIILTVSIGNFWYKSLVNANRINNCEKHGYNLSFVDNFTEPFDKDNATSSL